MISKDWIEEAADEIRSSTGDYGNTEIEEIIAKYCPFKMNVTYIPVPRCETCAHWYLIEPNSKEECTEVLDLSFTPKDFGCVHWKEKDQ